VSARCVIFVTINSERNHGFKHQTRYLKCLDTSRFEGLHPNLVVPQIAPKSKTEPGPTRPRASKERGKGDKPPATKEYGQSDFNRNWIRTAEKTSDRDAKISSEFNVATFNVRTLIEAEKDQFYEDLDKFICSIPPHTVTIVAGDFNAQIEKDSHISMPKVVGPNCCHHETNGNGQRLLNKCKATDLRPTHRHFFFTT
jgi:hypothetical protein